MKRVLENIAMEETKIKRKKAAKRINESFTKNTEQKALQFIVKLLPAAISPDHLTFIGLLGGVIIAVGYYLCKFHPGFLWLASFGFFVNWFGDSLDGTVARHRKIERQLYGFYIDHNIDAITQFIMAIGLGLSPYMRFDIAMYVIMSYFMLSIHTYINAYLRERFKFSYGKIGPTEVRLIAIIANTVLFFIGKNPALNIFSISITLFDFAGVIIGTVFIGAFIYAFFKEKKVLNKMNPPLINKNMTKESSK